jgi:hypothetical protein
MAGGAETPNIAALPAIARLGADRRTTPTAPCADLYQQLLFKGVNRRGGPDADRHVKLLIQFAVEEVLSGAYGPHGA